MPITGGVEPSRLVTGDRDVVSILGERSFVVSDLVVVFLADDFLVTALAAPTFFAAFAVAGFAFVVDAAFLLVALFLAMRLLLRADCLVVESVGWPDLARSVLVALDYSIQYSALQVTNSLFRLHEKS